MTEFRTESDLLGEKPVPAAARYGVHTVRALENFPIALRPVHSSLIHAFGAVKLACCRVNARLGHLIPTQAQSLETACREMMAGSLDVDIVVDALQGGAGTSTNMNVNEVLANRGLELLGRSRGDYAALDPLAHVNLHQSTNDTYPTALRVAAITGLRNLQPAVIALQEAFQAQEKSLAEVVKIGRTQFQDAVLTTIGREMSAYGEALSRDRWRIYKCEERLRVVNLGGTAIGTGLAAPRQFIFAVVDELRAITGQGLARAENLVEATQNADVFVEVSGILKACACNLLKIANDLRLLSSGPDGGFGELHLPARQAGSSIMPGKVNPVIPEAVAQAAMMVFAYDGALTQAASLGSLELNAFLPLIADCLLNSIDLLTNACRVFAEHCVRGITADVERCRNHVATATATVTALVGKIGYKQAETLAHKARSSHRSIRDVAVESGLLTAAEFDQLISAEAVTRLGSPEGGKP
jgi:aspartate ammonia-lyase